MLSACAGISPTGQPDLEGTTWVLTAFNQNRPIEGTQPTITFEDGQVSGNAGCNSYGGSYQVKEDAISFDALFWTEMACMEPEGVMEQELAYLEVLGAAQRFELVGGVLTIFAGPQQTLTFETQQDNPAPPTPTLEQTSPISPTPTAELLEPTPTQPIEPPAGFKEYQDAVVRVSVYIPESWVVTGVIEGQYAIFQSYPEDKYVGGGAREPGDTKCDLNIRPPGTSADGLIQQWESNELTTIVSDEEFVLQSGLIGQRFIIESMGRSVALVTEINNRAVVLNCFGSPEPFDEIASTLNGFDADPSPIHDSEEGFKQYQDFETGVTVDVPGSWVITGIKPGHRATLQSFDLKCELFIQNDVIMVDFINQMKSNEAITIISEEEIVLSSGQPGTRIEMDSMGRSISVITEIKERVVVLTCFGDFAIFDEIAFTLQASE
jgi:heat shock protein HslJ